LGQLDVIVGMPVLLRSNLDMEDEDGLYNGAKGQVPEIITCSEEDNQNGSASTTTGAPTAVFVYFDNPKIGA